MAEKNEKAKAEGRGSEDRDQKSEVRDQKSEVRSQRSEVRGQEEVSGPETEDLTLEQAKKKDLLRKVRIIVHSRGENDSEFADVGLNFKAYRIRKGVEAEVPVGVYNVLRDAREKHKRRVSRDGQEIDEYVETPRFTVELLGPAGP